MAERSQGSRRGRARRTRRSSCPITPRDGHALGVAWWRNWLDRRGEPANVRAVQTGSETDVLKLMLAFQRLEMVRLASDLTEAQGRWRPHADANSIAELVSHLAWVERWWFESVFAGAPDLSADPRWPGFVAAEDRPMGDLIASYTSAW